MKCDLCGKEIIGHGNSGVPATTGIVCDHCNNHVVVPIRVYFNVLSGKRNCALLVKPHELELVTPKNKYFTLKELQTLVEGDIELTIPVSEGCFTVVNEDGLRKRLEPNFLANKLLDLKVVGNVLVVPQEIFEAPER